MGAVFDASGARSGLLVLSLGSAVALRHRANLPRDGALQQPAAGKPLAPGLVAPAKGLHGYRKVGDCGSSSLSGQISLSGSLVVPLHRWAVRGFAQWGRSDFAPEMAERTAMMTMFPHFARELYANDDTIIDSIATTEPDSNRELRM